MGDESSLVPPQQWHGIEIGVDTRPSPPGPGMNEVLIAATIPHRRPAYDSIISIRMKKEEPWVQAIQDGHTGIFRRALAMVPGHQTLWVRIERANEQSILGFPLIVAPAQ